MEDTWANMKHVARIFRVLGEELLRNDECPWFEINISIQVPALWVSMRDVIDKGKLEQGLKHFVRLTGEQMRS
jgi:hypothetical protein